MKMKNKPKIIGLVFFITLAVTVSYMKGIFDGPSGKNWSIVSIARADSIVAKQIKKKFKDSGTHEEKFIVHIVKDVDSVDFEIQNVFIVSKTDPTKTVKLDPKSFPFPPTLKLQALRSVNISFAWMEESPGRWCVVNSIAYWCP